MVIEHASVAGCFQAGSRQLYGRFEAVGNAGSCIDLHGSVLELR